MQFFETLSHHRHNCGLNNPFFVVYQQSSKNSDSDKYFKRSAIFCSADDVNQYNFATKSNDQNDNDEDITDVTLQKEFGWEHIYKPVDKALTKVSTIILPFIYIYIYIYIYNIK